MNTRLLGGTAFAALLSLSAAAPAVAQALDYSTIVVFGDSLSDTDNLKKISPTLRPGAPFVNGRFSNGPIWAENFAAARGVALDGRAFGGGRAVRTDVNDLTAQVTTYLAGNSSIPEDRLMAIWIGGNDYLDVLTQPQANPTAAAQAAVVTTTGAIGTQAGRLMAAGADQFVLLNLPPLGSIPLTSGLSAADKAAANSLSDLHAAALAVTARTMRNAGATVAIVDVNALFRDILAQPQTYGIANTTIPCYAPVGPGGSLVATGACATAAGAAGTVFYDALHPTAAAHAIVGQFVDGTLSATYEAPAINATATELGQRLFDLANQGVSARMAGARSGQGSVNLTAAQAGADGRFGFFGFGSYFDGERDATQGRFGYDYDGFNTGVGVDYQVDDLVLAGLAFSYGDGSLKTKGGLGRIDAKAYNLTTYITAAAATRTLWLDAYMSFSWDDYDLARQTRFAPFANAGGDSNGTTHGLGGTIGFTPEWGGYILGPVVGMRYAKTRIEGYAEQGGGLLSLTWDDWQAKSLVSSAGIQVSGSGSSFIPHLRLAWEHEFMNDGRDVTGAFANREIAYAEAGAGKRDRLAIGAGIAWAGDDNVSLAIGYDGRMEGGGSPSDHAFTGRVKVAF